MTKDQKLSLLINNPYMKSEDILSHDWVENLDAPGCLILKCKKCDHSYGLIVFAKGANTRLFSTPHGAGSDMKSCDFCVMETALC